MTSPVLIITGLLLLWVSMDETARAALKAPAPGGYLTINPVTYLLGAGVASLPLFFMENDTWKWRYIALVLLMVLTVNGRGVQRFSNYLSTVLPSSVPAAAQRTAK